MELHQDLVEEILLRSSVKSLLRFKSISIEWNSIIESQRFKNRYNTFQQSLDPNLLLVDTPSINKESCMIKNLILDSSVSIKLPSSQRLLPMITESRVMEIKIPNKRVSNSCDGLICIYNKYGEIFVVNPSTRRYREIHGSILEKTPYDPYSMINGFGFGKDICTGTYKIIWLHNMQNVYSCEVFNFNTNTWRTMKAPSYEILDPSQDPVHVNGSIYLLIDYDENSWETKVLSFDFHEETFEVILEFPTTYYGNVKLVNICNLNNRLCLSGKDDSAQNMWLLNDLDKTWEKMYSLDIPCYSPMIMSRHNYMHVARPLAILKNKLMVYDKLQSSNFIIYDQDWKSYGKCTKQGFYARVVPCFQSLISIP